MFQTSFWSGFFSKLFKDEFSDVLNCYQFFPTLPDDRPSV